jgi:hypothetical protein
MGQAPPKILHPKKPSECFAALSMSEGEDDKPYASILYTTHEGLITFFGLKVLGVVKEGDTQMLTYPSTRFNSDANEWQTNPTTNPDDADQTIAGTLERGIMEIETGQDELTLGSLDEATDFVSMIRMLYSMEAEGK